MPGERAFAKAAERAQDEERMIAVCVQPVAQQFALGEAAGEVGRHRVRMSEEPLLAPWLSGGFQNRWRAERGEQLSPGEFQIFGRGEVHIGEYAEARRQITFFFE